MRVPIAVPQRLKLHAGGAAFTCEIDDLIVTQRNRTAIAGLRTSTGSWSRARAWFVVSEHQGINGFERLLANVDFTWNTWKAIPSNREEAIAIIDLDFTIFVCLTTTRARLVGFDENFQSRTRRTNLGIAIEAINDLLSPRLQLASCLLDRIIEIHAAVRIISGEYKTDTCNDALRLQASIASAKVPQVDASVDDASEPLCGLMGALVGLPPRSTYFQATH